MVRRGRGGGMGGGINRRYLSQVMDSCGKDLATAEEIVDDLRSRYGNFARLTRQVLLLNVRNVLTARNNNNKRAAKDEEEDDNNGGGDDSDAAPSKMKKPRRVDEKEEKLQRAEQSHLKRRNRDKSPSSSSSSSSEEEDSGDISTSEDAIYSQKLSPRFDLINDSLRDNYAKMNNSPAAKKPVVEKNVEVETVTNNKGRSKMGLKKEARVSLPLSGTTPTDNNNNNNKGGGGGPTFKDFGGIKKVLDDLENYVLFPLLNPPPFKTMGVKPPSGILFHGPPGCGKTQLANAIANEVGVPFYQISATEVVSGVSGASEENIRELFSKAYRTAPSIVFIDEIDAIGSKRENQQREMEKRIVTQLLTCMDGPRNKGDKNDAADSTSSGYVLVIGATNRPDALDPALRRSGRFEREIALNVPDEDARAEILSVVAQRLRLEGSFDMKRIARLTPGFVGADLEGVANMAGSLGIKRVKDSRKLQLSGDSDNQDDRSWLRQPWSEEDLEKLFVRMSDFEEAVKLVKGSLTREGFSTVPNVTWGDVGGLDHLRRELNNYIVRPIKNPEIYKAFGASLETGFLLYGPPGCGKTLVAKAVANEAGANFIHIKGPELLNKYVGESELAIRTLFQRARTSSPCVLFFDEVDALTTSRGREGGSVVESVLNQFLTELDGGERRNVYVIGATNRPDVIDSALLRPGRFGNLVYVPLPNADERVLILKSIAKKRPIDPSVDLDAIAKNCEGFSGADLANLMDKAIHVAVKEKFGSSESSEDDNIDLSDCTIKMTHFEQGLSLVTPSVSKQQIKHYEELPKKLQRSTGRNNMEQINVGSTFALEENKGLS
ncbi:cell division control protein 48 homolog C [Brassica rapa]|uniref:AAA+ ATPase domain-containing protein n=1 Tax=Brassica campestris TaxID=3711 RepID=M4C9X0_BRACM|nr:cell division control protein 48 homolog C [Brassica rapa]XP_033143127.1 cell division control protein 48 homolog C [Brassica rapa]